MFLDEHPTPDEELGRTLLIAHETAHMWFGDLITMNWFNDVWTKEVFANYFAARITEPLFPDVNHRLSNLRTFYISSLGEDVHPEQRLYVSLLIIYETPDSSTVRLSTIKLLLLWKNLWS
jgi:Aminopeptidase N